MYILSHIIKTNNPFIAQYHMFLYLFYESNKNIKKGARQKYLAPLCLIMLSNPNIDSILRTPLKIKLYTIFYVKRTRHFCLVQVCLIMIKTNNINTILNYFPKINYYFLIKKKSSLAIGALDKNDLTVSKRSVQKSNRHDKMIPKKELFKPPERFLFRTLEKIFIGGFQKKPRSFSRSFPRSFPRSFL